MVRSTPLNPTDATLWDIERDPSLRTTIVAVLMLDRAVDPARLVNDLEAATRTVDRMRQRVVGRPGGMGAPSWVIDDSFDIDQHVRTLDLGDTCDEIDLAAISTVAERMASEPFDRSRPLWECTGVIAGDGPSALIVKVHHSLTDGVGGVQLLDALLDTDPAAPTRDLSTVPVPILADRDATFPGDVARLATRLGSLSATANSFATGAIGHPRRTATALIRGTQSAARLLAPAITPLSPLLVGRSGDRRVAAGEVDLARLHASASRHGCTVNHAFFAASIGGLADYHRHLGQPTAQLRVTMPVSLRRSDNAAGGNQWAPVRFIVPTDVDDPVERMLAMRALVLSARRERALGFSQTLAGLVQMMPSALSSSVVGGMMRGVDLTLTNVPGMTVPHYVAGAKVERLFAFAPTAGAALNVALVSHLDTACVGTLSDAAAIGDPAMLQELIDAGFDELIAAAEHREPSQPPATPTPAAPTETSPAGPERLSALDTGFLRLESDEMPMHIGAAFLLDGAALRDADGVLRIDDIRRHVEARLTLVPRFARRLAEVPLGLGRPSWVDDERFDIARHVRVIGAAAPGGRQQLLDVCAELFRSPLDRAHPLWELWIVDGLADGRVGMVEKVHHALIDGVSGVELAAALFDMTPDVPIAEPAPRVVSPAPNAMEMVAGAIAEQLADPARLAVRAFGAMTSPAAVARQIATAAAAGEQLLRTAGGAHRASFNREVGRDRTLRAVSIDRALIDGARRPLDATVNDLVLASVAGALRRWFEAENESPVDVHVLVPVSTRHGQMAEEPGNQVGGMLIPLPVAESDRRRRIALVRQRIDAARAVHEGESVAAVFDAIDHLPAIAHGAITRLVAAQPFVDLVVTNVPGPPDGMWFLGAHIVEMIPVVPLGPRLGLGIAALSYAGKLTISMFADPDACPDLDVLADFLVDEFDAYGQLSST